MECHSPPLTVHFAGRAGKARVRAAPPSHRLRSAAQPHRNRRRGDRRCPAGPRPSQSSSRAAMARFTARKRRTNKLDQLPLATWFGVHSVTQWLSGLARRATPIARTYQALPTKEVRAVITSDSPMGAAGRCERAGGGDVQLRARLCIQGSPVVVLADAQPCVT